MKADELDWSTANQLRLELEEQLSRVARKVVQLMVWCLENGFSGRYFEENGISLANVMRPLLHLLNDEELKILIFAPTEVTFTIEGCPGGGFNTLADAATNQLHRRVRGLDFEGRLALGRYFAHWRVWQLIVLTPGLSFEQIRQVRAEPTAQPNQEVRPWGLFEGDCSLFS